MFISAGKKGNNGRLTSMSFILCLVLIITCLIPTQVMANDYSKNVGSVEFLKDEKSTDVLKKFQLDFSSLEEKTKVPLKDAEEFNIDDFKSVDGKTVKAWVYGDETVSPEGVGDIYLEDGINKTLIPDFEDLKKAESSKPKNISVNDDTTTKYTITFMIDEGNNIFTTKSVIEGSKLTATDMNAPESSKWPQGANSFRGWYKDNSYKTLFDYNQTPIMKDTVLYAKFESTFLVQFKDENGIVFDSKEYKPQSVISETNRVSELKPPSGQRFMHWYEEGDNAKTPVYFGLNDPKASKDLVYAPFFSDACVVTFISDGSQIQDNPVLVNKGSFVTQPISPQKKGYIFDYWSTDPDGLNKFNFATTQVNNDLKLYAQWRSDGVVEYKIVQWIEKTNLGLGDPGPNPDNYEYYSHSVKSAPAGTSTNTLVDPNLAKEIKVKHADSNNYITIAKLDENFVTYSSSKVLGDGTTVINVYYKRVIFDIKFDLNPDTLVINRVVRMWFKNDPNTVYRQEGGIDAEATNEKRYSFKAKYEDDITNLWPSSYNADFVRTNRKLETKPVSNPRFHQWAGGHVTHKFTLTSELLPTSNTTTSRTFTAVWGSSGSLDDYTVNYYFEALPGESTVGAIYTNGKYYVKDTTYSQTYRGDSRINSAKEITGMKNGKVYSSSGNTTTLIYDRITYTLNIDLKGGSAVGYNQTNTLKYGENISPYLPKANPTKSEYGIDYDFDGWYYDSNYVREFNKSDKILAKDETLYAKWQSTEYDIRFYNSFNPADEITSKAITAGRGDYIPDTKLPYVKGEVVPGLGTFKGWYYKIGNDNFEFDNNKDAVYKDLDLFAAWDRTGFTIKYDVGNGGGTAPVDNNTYDLGTSARIMDETPSMKANAPVGTSFIGWKAQTVGGNNDKIYYAHDIYEMSGNTTMVALYDDIDSYWKLTYNSNYPDGQNNITRENLIPKSNNKTDLPGSNYFTSAKYELIGWSTTSKPAVNDNPQYTTGQTLTINDNTELFAIWKAKSSTIEFKVGFSDGELDGKLIYDNILLGTTWGAANIVVPTASSTNADYYFSHWDPSIPDDDFEITKSAVYTAQFEKYRTVEYVTDARGTISGQALYEKIKNDTTVGAVAPAPDVTAKPGYRFDGWEISGSGIAYSKNQIINDDIIYVAKYTSMNDVTVEFTVDANGKLEGTTSFAISYGAIWGNEIKVPTPSGLPGFKFVHWSPELMESDYPITTNMAFKAITTDMSNLKVTFEKGEHGNLSGQALYYVPYDSDAADITPPSVNAHEGYKFTGWSPTLTGKITTDRAFVAKYTTMADITVTFKALDNGSFAGETNKVVTDTVSYGAAWTKVDVPTPKANIGYEFEKWTPAFPKVVTTAALYEASFEKKPDVTVTFEALTNGGFEGTNDKIITDTVSYGATWTAVNVPIPKADVGYEFEKWTPIFPGTVTKAALYKASFKKMPDVTVTFKALENGGFAGTGDKTVADTVSYGATWTDVTVPTPKANIGYEFEKWTPTFPGMVTKAGLYEASFEKKPDVTIEFNEGLYGSLTSNNKFIVPYGSVWTDVISVPGVKADVGYEFTDWDNKFPAEITKAGVFTAQYKSMPDVKVTFNNTGQGGSLNGTTQFTVSYGALWGDKITVPTPVADPGYIFDSWDPELYKANMQITTNKAFEVLFKLVPDVRVTFNAGTNGTFAGGQKVINVNVSYGALWSTINVPTATPDTGYNIAGWDKALLSASTKVQTNYTFTMLYTVIPGGDTNGGGGTTGGTTGGGGGGDDDGDVAGGTANPTTVRTVLAGTGLIPQTVVDQIEEIITNPVPLDNTTIDENDVAKDSGETGGTWALLNLVMTILTLLIALALIIKRRDVRSIMSVIPGIAAAIMFFVTEDMSLRMAMTDEYTLWTALIMVIAMIYTGIVLRKQKDEEEGSVEG